MKFLTTAVATVALAATPAHASQIYAGQPSGASPFQFVMGLSNDGKRVTQFTFHFDVLCSTDFNSVDWGDANIVADMPEQAAFGEHYMVAPRIAGKKLSGTFFGFDRVGDTTIERMTATITGALKPGSARGKVAVNFVRSDQTTGDITAQCARSFKWKALRTPGVVYGGRTSQDEPVVLELTADRKHVSHAHLGWYATCAQQDIWWSAAHDEFDLKPFPLSSSGAFSKTYSLDYGDGTTELERFAGKVSRKKASGTFRADISVPTDTGSNPCTSGAVSWRVVTG